MVIGGIVGQFVPNQDDDFGDILFDAYAPQAIGLVIILVLALVIVAWSRSRARSGTEPSSRSGLPVSGWYPDPGGQPYDRWWNGGHWTNDVRVTPPSWQHDERSSWPPS